MSSNNIHNASGQMAGYLYQVLAALSLLLDSKENNDQVCIEKFDDIAFIEKDEPILMIQTKHQLYRPGNLSDTSVDLWRTIKSWCDSIQNSPTHLLDTDFVILTTSIAQEKTVAYYLRKDANRNTNEAIRLLIAAAKAETVQANEKYYSAFLGLSPELQDNLIRHTYVYDNSQNISNLKTDIMRYIRCATLPQFEKRVYNSVLGWWINAVIQCLCSEDHLPIRERVTQPFIMRGSYHDLANRMMVGWHIDFMERLCHLLRG